MKVKLIDEDHLRAIEMYASDLATYLTMNFDKRRGLAQAIQRIVREAPEQEVPESREESETSKVLTDLIGLVHRLLPQHQQFDSTLDNLPEVQAARALIAKEMK